MNTSIELGRIRGISIGVSWSWFVVFALIVWTLADNVFPSQNEGYSTGAYIAMAVVAALAFFVSLLAHELGHALVARREGMEIDGITLWLFGGVARFKGSFPTAGGEFRIAIAGPIVSLLDRRRLRGARRRSPSGAGRRGALVARLHQPRPARVQPVAGAPARRGPRPPLRALEGTRRLRLRQPGVPCSSAADSRSS